MAFSFIQITDHHLRPAETDLVRGMSTDNSLRTVLRHIAQHAAPRADFIVSMGDFIDPPSDAAYLAVLSRLGVERDGAAPPGPLRISSEGLRAFPIYFVPGNHDDRDAFCRCLFPKAAPMPLMNVRFEYQGVQFICLDWGTDATLGRLPGNARFPGTRPANRSAIRDPDPSPGGAGRRGLAGRVYRARNAALLGDRGWETRHRHPRGPCPHDARAVGGGHPGADAALDRVSVCAATTNRSSRSSRRTIAS